MGLGMMNQITNRTKIIDMEFKELIAKIRNTTPFENLNGILGKPLGELLYKLVDKAEEADQELDTLHLHLKSLRSATELKKE